MRALRYAAIVVIACGLVACTSDPEAPETPTPSVSSTPTSSTPAPSPTPKNSANAVAAMAAYRKLLGLLFEGQRQPAKADYAAMERVAIDVALSDVKKSTLSLDYEGLVYRGIKPVVRPVVTHDTPFSKPYPIVVLVDCPAGTGKWKLYSSQTGDLVESAPVKAPPPYSVTATIIYIRGRWAVSKLVTDRSATCVR